MRTVPFFKTKQFTITIFLFLVSSFFLFGQDDYWVPLTQKIDIEPYIGKKFKLEAAVKVSSVSEDAHAALWARVDNADGTMGFFDNMNDRPIKSDEWKIYRIEGEVNENAKTLLFGGLAIYDGKFFFDDFKLFIWNEEIWIPLSIKNPGFEKAEKENGLLEGWSINLSASANFSASIVKETVFEGNSALLIKGSGTEYFNPQDLFKKFVGIWEMNFSEGQTTSPSDSTDTSIWKIKTITGGYGLDCVITDDIEKATDQVEVIFSYHPNFKKLNLIWFNSDSPPWSAEGSMDPKGNIKVTQILPDDLRETYPPATLGFTWVNDNEFEIKVEQGTSFKVIYSMIRKN